MSNRRTNERWDLPDTAQALPIAKDCFASLDSDLIINVIKGKKDHNRYQKLKDKVVGKVMSIASFSVCSE